MFSLHRPQNHGLQGEHQTFWL